MALLLLVTMMMGQDHHRAMSERGAMVMGFDQEKTVHHFRLYQDGEQVTFTCCCDRGFVCADHLDQPDTHDGCQGAGMRCPNLACAWWQGDSPAVLDGAVLFDGGRAVTLPRNGRDVEGEPTTALAMGARVPTVRLRSSL